MYAPVSAERRGVPEASAGEHGQRHWLHFGKIFIFLILPFLTLKTH